MMNKQNVSEGKEVLIEGIPASAGAVIGTAYIHSPAKSSPSAKQIETNHIQAHLTAFDQAKKAITNEWNELREKQTDENLKNILESQIEIIRDPELSKRIQSLIKDNQLNVQKAIQTAFDTYAELFSESNNSVISGRSIDITDIRDRLIDTTINKAAQVEKKGDIVVAEDLSPREIIALSHQNIEGIIIERGGRSSHAAIIARSIGIPAVIGAGGATDLITGKAKICLNGQNGIVYINPTSHTCSQIKKLIGETSLSKQEKQDLCQHVPATSDGQHFTLRANIEFPEELNQIQRCKAEGVGLLRTEAVYLDHSKFGSRQSQQIFYEQILEKTSNHAVTIRLFDVGGDKFLNKEVKENNPFLGWRGIRMLLDERDLLREQLTAILAAAGHHPGRVKILLPMVTMISEIEEVKKEVKRCRQILIDDGHPVDEPRPLGIMVETPNVAIQSARFAERVDFFSIGTNDLIQYLLAVDRGNARISRLYNQVHPVMWKMIHQAIKAGHQENIDVEICGELASYPAAAACLLGMDADGLSMNPASLMQVKKLLIGRNSEEMKTLSAKTLQCSDVEAVENLFDNWKNRKNEKSNERKN